MRLTDEQLRRLVASDPSDAEAVKELRKRTRWAAIRKLGPRTGTLNGHPVVEDKASGYWCYKGQRGGTLTSPVQYAAIIYDPPTDHDQRLRALIDSLD